MIENIQLAFWDAFHSAPIMMVRSPGRVNLIGEHTDYNGGYVLPGAIDKAVYFAIGPRNDNKCHLIAMDLKEEVVLEIDRFSKRTTETWSNYLMGVVDQFQKAGKNIGGFNLVFGGDLPQGGGMSSSAAIENGIGFALNKIFNLGYDRLELVQISQSAENEFVGMNCGIMDMFASMMGQKNSVVRLDCRSLDYTYFPFDPQGYSLVLCDTGVKHQLVDSEYNTRRIESEEGVRILSGFNPEIQSLRDVDLNFLLAHSMHLRPVVLRRCRFVVMEIARVEKACEALQRHDFVALGQLMFETHHGLNLDYEVSCPELNFLVDLAEKSPEVIGSRMMGGGFGGCTINLIKEANVESFLSVASRAYKEQFGISMQVYRVAPAAGTEEVIINKEVTNWSVA